MAADRQALERNRPGERPHVAAAGQDLAGPQRVGDALLLEVLGVDLKRILPVGTLDLLVIDDHRYAADAHVVADLRADP